MREWASIRVVCGKGTYIRSLARDIGEAIGSGAYLTSLCRTQSGNVRIEDCLDFDRFKEWLSQQEIEPYPCEDNNGNADGGHSKHRKRYGKNVKQRKETGKQ